MSLSNTATPKYYGQFRDSVFRGDTIVCETIALEMKRIDALIANPAIYYDESKVEGYIKFCESELTLTDGSDMRLLDSFKLWAEEVYGWYYFIERMVWTPDEVGSGGHYEMKIVKKRLITKQYLIVARGAAKTAYATTIHAYDLIVDTSTTDQIATAPTIRQAEETLNLLRTAITRARGPVLAFMTQGSINNTTGPKSARVKIASTKKGIENFMTGSILRTIPMSIDKLQGLRVKDASLDEWLSCEIREDPVGAIEQGASKERGAGTDNDYLILATSSEGTIRNGIGDSMKLELMKILKGEYEAIRTSIFYYQLDDIKEVADPRMWIKANPNIGKTVSYETYQLDLDRAEAAPATRNDILAKRFGIPCEGYTYFFTYAETIIHPRFNCDGAACALGIDLSRGDDFCAFTFLFPHNDGSFSVKTRSYISSRTYDYLPTAAREKYNEFIDEDSLMVLNCSVLDMDDVFDDLDRFINDKHKYDIRTVGYDPYNAKGFITRWEQENGAYAIEKVIQGSKTESVPLGELKALSEDRMIVFDESLMSFTIGNCIAIIDTNGNRKLYKNRHDQKIDNVAAMLDAYVAYKLHTDEF